MNIEEGIRCSKTDWNHATICLRTDCNYEYTVGTMCPTTEYKYIGRDHMFQNRLWVWTLRNDQVSHNWLTMRIWKGPRCPITACDLEYIGGNRYPRTDWLTMSIGEAPGVPEPILSMNIEEWTRCLRTESTYEYSGEARWPRTNCGYEYKRKDQVS